MKLSFNFDSLLSYIASKEDSTLYEHLKNLSESDILLPVESDILTKVMNFYSKFNKFPSIKQIESSYPQFNPISVIESNEEFVHNVRLFIKDRQAQDTSESIMSLSDRIQEEGFTPDIFDKIRSVYEQNKSKSNLLSEFDFKSEYQKRKEYFNGFSTLIPEIDKTTGGFIFGTLSTIAGFVGSFKTTYALNVFYNAFYNEGINCVFISREMPKDIVYANLLSRHSMNSKFDKFPFIHKDKIIFNKLSEEEEDYLLNVIYPDLLNNAKGKFEILDETDFSDFSITDIEDLLFEIDNKKFRIDAVFMDYIQLLRTVENKSLLGLSSNDKVNYYVSYFRQLSLDFRGRKIAVIIVSQINRQGHLKAVKNKGRYDLEALSESNAIERDSSVIITLFGSEELTYANELKVCLLKNRFGYTIYEPITISIQPESYAISHSEDKLNFDSVSVEDLLLGGDEIDL